MICPVCGPVDRMCEHYERVAGWQGVWLKEEFRPKREKEMGEFVKKIKMRPELFSSLAYEDKVEVANLVDFKNRYNKQKRK